MAIKLAGSNNELTGLMYAPNGTIEISGGDHTLTSTTGVAWGVWVKMNGSLSGISASGAGELLEQPVGMTSRRGAGLVIPRPVLQQATEYIQIGKPSRLSRHEAG